LTCFSSAMHLLSEVALFAASRCACAAFVFGPGFNPSTNFCAAGTSAQVMAAAAGREASDRKTAAVTMRARMEDTPRTIQPLVTRPKADCSPLPRQRGYGGHAATLITFVLSDSAIPAIDTTSRI